MSQGLRRPHEAVDYAALTRMLPPPPEYFETFASETPEQIEARQLARLRERALSAYRVPFFRRRWDAAGFDPRAIESLAGRLDGTPKPPAHTDPKMLSELLESVQTLDNSEESSAE